MIKVGNILIDPNDISSIHLDMKSTPPTSNHERGIQVIQIIYKNGVVKNFTSAEIGMSYSDFIDSFLIIKEKEETDRIFRIMAAIKSANNV
jgi:hypothetical protein